MVIRGRAGFRQLFVAVALLLLGHPALALPGRSFATEIACEKTEAYDVATCRRAFAMARADYLAHTRAYRNRATCYRAFGPCMPWPLGAGAFAQFRPQWMGIVMDGVGGDATAAPMIAAGRIKLSFTPRPLGGPLPVEVASETGEPSRPGPQPKGALCRQIEAIAAKEHLPSGFLARLLWQESSFRTHVVSPAGALGIAQFMPETAQERGLDDPFDPERAIATSAALLRDLTRRFGNLGLAAAAYNGGPARVSGWLKGRRTLAPETHDYVQRITGRPIEDWAARSNVDVPPVGTSISCPELAGPVAGSGSR